MKEEKQRHLKKVVKIKEAAQWPNDKKLFEHSEFFLSVAVYSVDFLNFIKQSRLFCFFFGQCKKERNRYQSSCHLKSTSNKTNNQL